MRERKRIVMHFALIAIAALLATQPFAQESDNTKAEESVHESVGLEIVQADSLEELLQNVKDRRVVESSENKRREREFEQRKSDQQVLLNEAKAAQRREEERSERLKAQFDQNETEIKNQQERFDERLGSLRELFGVLTQVAGDARGVFAGSVITAEYPGRGDFLDELASKMGTAVELATIDEMEHMWYLLQQEMVESSKVTRFRAAINQNDGGQVEKEVIRVGSFNLVTDDGYINYDISNQKLVKLARQPSAEFANTADDLYAASPGEVVAFAIDPTRGSLLSLEIQRATLSEMVGTPFGGFATGKCYLPFCDGQGGIMGAIIILVGIVGVLMALERLISLTLIKRNVGSQKKDTGIPNLQNPLGRVIQVYHDNRDTDVETLQLKLGEAVLQETPAITRNITIIQVISVIAPLMGLLGTVIGMIQTFQAITLFGTGDPKIMASGISTALMTTVLGLCVAIPTVLLHALVSQRSRGVIHVLDEQSEGIIARHAEDTGQSLG